MNKTEVVLKRLDRISKYSEGYFLAPFLFQNQTEKSLFGTFKSRNDFLFDVVLDGRTKIFKANMSYNFKRGLKILSPRRNSKSIAMRLIWSAFITDIEEDLVFPFASIKNGGHNYFVDNFASERKKVDGTVLTFDPKRAKKYGFHIPKLLQKKSFQRIISELLEPQKELPAPEKVDKEFDYIADYVMKNFLEDGVWPDENQYLHTGYRKYPALPDKVDGELKAEYDRYMIENEKQIEGYKFGVYQ